MRLRRKGLHNGPAADKPSRRLSLLIEPIRKQPVLKGIVLGSLLFSLSACGLQRVANVQEVKKPVASIRAASEVEWKKTHLIVINGDWEYRHEKNAYVAAKTGLNNAAKVQIAGRTSNDESLHAERFPATRIEIEGMLREVKADKVFLYVTGHGIRNGFVIGSEILKHKDLLAAMEKHLKGKEIIFVSDACYSADFVELIMESNSFKHIFAMSPGLVNETTSCSYFAIPFWHALRKRLDLDGDGRATIEEAFYYGLKEYRKLKPYTLGSFRKTLPMINSLSEVRDGIVMATSEWCEPCKSMEPHFNRISLLIGGKLNFYLIDAKNTEFSVTPTTVILRNGEVITSKEGFMNSQELTGWMNKNGMGIKKFGISVKELRKQGREDLVVLVFGWKGISSELGEKKAIALLTSLFKHEEYEIYSKAAYILGTAAVKNPGKFIPYLRALLKKKNHDVRKGAVSALGEAARKGLDMSKYKGTIEDLGELLKEDEFPGRYSVTIALSYIAEKTDLIGYPGIVEALKRLLEKGEPFPSFGAAEALGRVAERKPEKLVPYFRGLLKHENPGVRYDAVYALKEVGKKVDLRRFDGVLEGLVQLLKDDDSDVRRNAARALEAAALKIQEEENRKLKEGTTVE